MKKYWTLDQLHLAEELAFPTNIETILKSLVNNECWVPLAIDIKTKGLLSTIFSYSRADYNRVWGDSTNNLLMGEIFDIIISRLLDGA